MQLQDNFYVIFHALTRSFRQFHSRDANKQKFKSFGTSSHLFSFSVTEVSKDRSVWPSTKSNITEDLTFELLVCKNLKSYNLIVARIFKKPRDCYATMLTRSVPRLWREPATRTPPFSFLKIRFNIIVPSTLNYPSSHIFVAISHQSPDRYVT
jgi:hypothetical protein